MKILIISLFSDNFGDMLIRICFSQLLKTVLNNLGVTETAYQVQYMSLNEVQDDLVGGSDYLFFAGGGLFGLSYLNLFGYMERILAVADERQIPVIFSSMGFNNMDAEKTQGSEKRIADLLKADCIKAMSVREDRPTFQRYANGSHLSPELVCDAAVWSRYIFHADVDAIIQEKRSRRRKQVGINVVRGGLFKANGVNWNHDQEKQYLHKLAGLFETAGIECVFYTNGSFLDDRGLQLFFSDEEENAAGQTGKEEVRTLQVNSARELVKTIASFDAVAAIRMHSSILSYALGIPAVNVIWNDKIRCFYENIGHPDRTVNVSDILAETVFEKISTLLEEKEFRPDPEYMMTLYAFLYRTLSNLLPDTANRESMWTFEQVTRKLQQQAIPLEEDILDYKIKIRNEARGYLNLTNREQEHKAEILQLKKEKRALDKQKEKLEKQKEKLEVSCSEQQTKIQAQKDKLDAQKQKLLDQKEKLEAQKQKTKDAKEKAKNYKEQLDQLNHTMVVRMYRKLHRNSH